MELSSLRFPAITPHCSTSSSLPPILFGPPLQNRLLFSQAAGQSCTQLGCPEAAPNPCLAARRGEIPSGVNKPYLPIAAGDLSVKSAWLLVVFFAVTGLLIVGLTSGPFITSLYGLGLFLGTIYSVPPLRMKRFPVAAFLIIASVRGFLFNFGVYYVTRAALGLQFEWSSAVAFITTFVTLFALVIAITKDLPDVEGDRKFEISTFATKLGVRNIAFLGSGLLLLNYVGSVFAASLMPEAFRRSLMIPMHAILALSLVFQEASANYYRFIWNLFYAEYILFPFI